MCNMTKSIRDRIAQRLQQARKEAGFVTAKEFAEKHDIPQPTYAMHEKGTRGLRPETLRHYAELLGKSDSWFLEEENAVNTQRIEASSSGQNQEATALLLSAIGNEIQQNPEIASRLSDIYFRCLQVLEALEGTSPDPAVVAALVKSEVLRPR